MPALDNNKKILPAFAAIFVAQLLLLAPLNLYMNNLQDISLPLAELLKLLLVPALPAFLLLALPTYLLPASVSRRLAVLLAALATLVWLQGNLLLWDYGLLDGRLIDWGQYRWQGWLDAGIWLVVLLAALLLARRSAVFFFRIATLLLIVQLATSLLLVLQQREVLFAEPSGNDQALENLYRFSGQRNVVHLMLDGFQSDVFQTLIDLPGLGEQYRQAFHGFTYFPETLGVFPYTRFSVPSFLAGKLYDNDMPQDDFVDMVLAGDTIISLARQHGFAVDIATGEPYLQKRYRMMAHDYLYGIDNSDAAYEEAARLLDIALFRSLPHYAKPLVYNRQQWLLSRALADDKGMRFNYFKHTYFLQRLARHMTADREQPVYKYIHVMNTHNPMVTGPDCRYLGRVVPMTRDTLTIQTKCTLDTLAMLFAQMQALGIYDNSLIIVQADHGGWVGNLRQQADIPLPGTQLAPDWVASLASPMLAIKLPGAQHGLDSRNTLASLADVPDTIADIMGWPADFGHLSLYSQAAQATDRQRTFRFYGWRDNEWNEQYAAPIVEFSVTGSHYDGQWRMTRMFYPPGKPNNKVAP